MSSSELDETIVQRLCNECGVEYSGEVSPCPHRATPISKVQQFTLTEASLADTNESALIGEVFAKHYEIIELVGTGGMSSVYKARHVLMDRIVAIKVLHSHLLSQSRALMRFQQEAKAASHLSHRNIVAVHDFGLSPREQPYLIMDYLEGVSLAEVIQREDHLAVERAVKIFLQICDGLWHAHQKGIVHRDLKPSNVMLVKDDSQLECVKIVDFGIAKLMPHADTEGQHLTKTGEIFGSPLYMSPEQCMGQALDARSDVYSLGCVMYETLVGRPPFSGSNVMETMYMRLTDAPPRFASVSRDLIIPEPLEAIVLTALVSEPDDRYQSMAELKEHLEMIQPGAEGQLASRIAIPKTSGKFKKAAFKKKGPSADLVYSISFALLLCVAFFAWREYTRMSMASATSNQLKTEMLWQENERNGQKQLDLGNYQAAEGFLLTAVKQAHEFGEHDARLTKSLQRLANLYHKQGKSQDAEQVEAEIAAIESNNPLQVLGDADSNMKELVDLTLALVPKTFRKENWAQYHALTEKLGHLALLCMDKKNFEQAKILWGKELEIERQTMGEESTNVASTLSNLASIYHKNEGQLDKAEAMYLKALTIRQKVLGQEHHTVADSLVDLAGLEEDQGKLSQAEGHYKKALEIYKPAFGLEHQSTARALEGLAGLYRLEGQNDKAEELYRQVIAIYEKILGQNNPLLYEDLNNLAGIYCSQGKYALAEPLFKRALEISEKSYGSEHQSVATILTNLGAVLYKQNKLTDAEPLLRRSLAIRERILPPNHPELAQSMNGLGHVYCAQGKYKDAEQLLKQALDINEQTFGSDAPETALVLNGLGKLYESKRDFKKAESLLTKSLEIRQDVAGKDHPASAASMADLAELYSKEGKFKQSESLYHQALTIMKLKFVPNHPDVLETLEQYANLLWQENKYAECLHIKAHVWAARYAPWLHL